MAIDQQLSDLPSLANLPASNGNIYLRNDNEPNVADKDQRFDLAAKITAMDSAIDSKQAAGSYAPVSHDHDDRYYTEAEVDALLANVGGGGAWEEIASGSVGANTLLNLTGLNGDDYIYELAFKRSSNAGFSRVTFNGQTTNTAIEAQISSGGAVSFNSDVQSGYYGSHQNGIMRIKNHNGQAVVLFDDYLELSASIKIRGKYDSASLTSFQLQSTSTFTYRLFRLTL